MIFIEPEISFKLEKCIKFLIEEYSKTGANEKPVVLHCLRVAVYLLEAGYGYEIAAAAMLHDLIEDAVVPAEKIEQEFGREIADIVSAVSFDRSIADPEENYKEMLSRTKAQGRSALLVKAADMYNNSLYLNLVGDNEKRKRLLDKYAYFLDLSEEIIGGEKPWQDLKHSYSQSIS